MQQTCPAVHANALRAPRPLVSGLSACSRSSAQGGIVARPDRISHAAWVRWCVYLLCCGDGTLYAGVTNDLEKRLAAHRSGRGARYTRGRGPLQIVHCEPARSRSAALCREHQLKRLKRRDKLALLDTPAARG